MNHGEGTGNHEFKTLTTPLGQRSEDEVHESGRPTTSLVSRRIGGNATASHFKTQTGVYEAIVKHQRDAEWWVNHDDLEMLRDAADSFIRRFDLRVKDAVLQAVPLIRIESMNVRTMGRYRASADGYALPGTIALNEERLRSMPPFMKLALLLKLLLCAWQHQRGGNGRFDRECRERMKSVGLIITEKGALTIEDGGAFRRLLMERGIDVPVESTYPRPSRRGKTTLQLWSCTCQKCRVGTRAFFAICPACREPFRLGDHVGKRFVDGATTATARR